MPLNREWFEEAEVDLADSPFDDAAIASVEEEIRRLYEEEKVVWHSEAWRHIDAILEEEFKRETALIFAATDPQELMFARERGRVISRLRKRPEEVAARLQELAKSRRILVGEEAAPEE